MPRKVAAVVSAVFLAGACGGGSKTDHVPAGEATSSVERIPPGASGPQVGALAVNGLGLDLLALNTGLGRGNVALSPWSIATALAMARVGAGGQTDMEMERVLHVLDPATHDQAMNALDQAVRGRNLTTPRGDRDPLVVDLSAANRLFVQTGLRLVPGFLDTLAGRYGAAVGEVDYKAATEVARTSINGWVAAETRDRIPELIGAGVLDELTRLVLANAVYLRADWATPFAKNATAEGTFHAPAGDTKATFLHGTERWGWSEGDGWKAVELPYTGGQLAMTFVVPDAGQFDRFVSSLDEEMLERVVATQPAAVRLRMPKFNIDRSMMLGRQLRALGMRLAFSDDADFSGITTDEELAIAELVHQANITVDEKGTVAAAATAPVMRATSGIAGEPKELDVDRPFLFLLRDRPTGALLFAGQVTNPV